MNQLNRIIIASLFLLTAISCGAESDKKKEKTPTPWAWAESTPEAQGLSSKAIGDLISHIRDDKIAVHSLVIARNGSIAVEANFYPFSGAGPAGHDIASVTKSIMSMLIGVAVDRGEIASIDTPALDFFPEYQVENSAEKQNITIRHLLTMTAGFDCGYDVTETELFEMFGAADWPKFVLDMPIAAEPGETWAYCSGGFHLLSAILTRATGMAAEDYADKYLFGPLGFGEYLWSQDSSGINRGWGDLHLQTRDLASIGELFRSGGELAGRRILSQAWIDASIATSASPSSEIDYGYGWWMVPGGPFDDIYYAEGRGGQRILVWPSKNLVIAITGGAYDFDALQVYLLPVLKSEEPLPEDATAQAALDQLLDEIKQPPEPNATFSLPSTAAAISGKEITLAENMFGFKSMTLQFDGEKEATGQLVLDDIISGIEETIEVNIGLDGVYRFAPTGENGLDIGALGVWTDDSTFELTINLLADINSFVFDMEFYPGGVTIEYTEITGLGAETITGNY